MKSKMAFVTFVAATAFALGATAQAVPMNPKAYCAKHRNFQGVGEIGPDQVPSEVLAAGGNTWRCMDGRVLVCNMGADGSACARNEKVDARRMAAFRQFCAQSPDNNFIPMSLITGLASTWRCDGTRPVKMSTQPTDRFGYFRTTWHPLN